MTALLATAAAALYGCADFFGGVASRKDSPLAISALSQLVGVAILAVAILAFPVTALRLEDVLWGGAAGFLGAWGVVALYAGLASGRMSLVAPVTASLAASLPVLYDLAGGRSPNPLSFAGIATALVAIVLISLPGEKRGGEADDFSPRTLLLSVGAGVAFAGFFILMSFTDPVSGLWPIAGARAVSVPMLLVLTLARRRTLAIAPAARGSLLAAGLLDMGANVFVLMALQRGPLAVAAVLSSLYPIATVLLARAVLHEHLAPRQRIGVVLALTAVVLASA